MKKNAVLFSLFLLSFCLFGQNEISFKNGKTLPSKNIFFNVKTNYLASYYSFPENADDVRHGIGLHLSSGYRFTNLMTVGLGMGFDTYFEPEQNQSFFPIFVETTGFITKNPVSLIYNFQIGYAFPGRNDESPNIRNRGGAFVYPAVGLLFAGRDLGKFTVDFGYKFQNTVFEATAWGWWFNYEVRDSVWIKSLAVRMGWSF